MTTRYRIPMNRTPAPSTSLGKRQNTFNKVAGAYGLSAPTLRPSPAAMGRPAAPATQGMARQIAAAAVGHRMARPAPTMGTMARGVASQVAAQRGARLGPVSLDTERYSNRPFFGGGKRYY